MYEDKSNNYRENSMGKGIVVRKGLLYAANK